jgi:hypothetical protein
MLQQGILLQEKEKISHTLNPIVEKIFNERQKLNGLMDDLKDIEVDCYLKENNRCVNEIVNLRVQYEKQRRRNDREQNSLHSNCFYKFIPAHMREAEREPVRTKEDLECFRKYISCKRDSYNNYLIIVDKEKEIISEMIKKIKKEFELK